jgi:NTP pyrophosphatase (non-canonical NTP hydrolase)
MESEGPSLTGGETMKDCLLKDPRIFEMVMEENNRQVRKWGIQDRDQFEWLAYTTEELGELSNAISEYTYRDGLQSSVIKEAIQTATLCLKIAEIFMAIPNARRK